jgi:NitT/TauT family transport system permease protein
MSEENNKPTKKTSKFFKFFNKGKSKTIEVTPGAETKIVEETKVEAKVEEVKEPSAVSRLLKVVGLKLKSLVKGFHPRRFLDIFVPNKRVSPQIMGVVVVIWVLGFGMYWTNNTSEIIPRPGEIWDAFLALVNPETEYSATGKEIIKKNLIGEMWTSMKLCVDAVFHTIIISLIICYATVLPVFKPIGFIISKFRFWSLVGLSFVFTLLTDDGYDLKVWLLTFGMTVFFTTGMLRVLKDITQNELNHARTLGMSEWRVVWEVVILSKIDKVFDVIRNNFAIAWMMLTLVEGLSRADGGIGAMLINQNKHLHLDAVFAIQFLILFVGVGMDYMFGVLKRMACPYAHLTKGFK